MNYTIFRYVLALFTLVLTGYAHANNSVPLNSLGKLSLSYSSINALSTMEKPVSTGMVKVLPGSPLRIVAPMNPQKIDYLVAHGESVTQNQRIAILSGSEVHHFRENLAAKTALLEIATSRFNKNRELVSVNAIPQDKWLNIAQQYYDAQLAWGHLNHFAEMFEPQEDDDMGYLLAPSKGVFMLPEQASADTETQATESQLGAVVSPNDIRLSTLVNALDSDFVEAINTDSCSVNIERVEEINHRFFVRVWSAPIPEGCALQLGAHVNTRVQLSVSALTVSADSVFYLHGQASVFVRRASALEAVPITLIGNADNDNAVFTAEGLTKNDEVLTSSISAVQGILLGLGGIE
ncbi:hypothetical protein [Alteromonas sp. BMJM2]|uniref:hypothetical protein n=1 Tax=Alteromonas sp. BMJM2 TaxID=2954241 RepID=UPI0022B51813|nr:hypothetical protein [Alteromonas sp. BMJM2]